MLNVECFLLLLFLIFASSDRAAAADFGDVSVSASAMYSGNTFHGYSEIRVTLANRSAGRTHIITLTAPHQSWNNGNSIGRLARSVKLEPGAREVVSLLQPPLPANGDGNVRVEVDGRHEGEVRAPNGNSHCAQYSGRGNHLATVLISRSLNFDDAERVFKSQHDAFTAAMAVGPPDAKTAGAGGYATTSWMPDTRRNNRTNWLELDYATPQVVNKIFIHSTQTPSTSGDITLIGISGTNLAQISMSASVPIGTSFSRSAAVMARRRIPPTPGEILEFSIPATSEPVKTVRLNFGKEQPWRIGIDAVEISGTAPAQWASAARASSDNSASAASYGARANADVVETLRAESPVAEWSENWLAYTPFDVIVLNAADLGSLSPAVLTAIGDYLSAGGNVVLSGKTDLPAAWHPAQKKSLFGGSEYEVGFGRCFAFSSENPASLDAKSMQTLREAVRDAAHYWQALPAESGAANAAMPVVENLKIPTRGIVVIMLAFIIVIGPVNLIYLNRRNRRTWMLWTIPAISFATTLLVFAYSLLREGITPDTRIAGLTVIDQASHHATTIGATAFYCPLTPSGGLHFDYGTEATPLVQIGYGSGTSREVDWTQAQHFSRGWVSARVPVHFHLRKSETRRERIQVVNENGKLQIVNGLGAPIKLLWLADAGGKIYQASNVAAGQKAGLVPATETMNPEKLGVSRLLRDISFAAVVGHGDSTVKYLLPGTYTAELDGNPFIENALGAASSPKRTKSSAVVFGILDADEKLGGAK